MRAVEQGIEEGLTPAEAIRKLMTDKGTSVSKIARDHKLQREDLSNVVNGRLVPRPEHLAALSTELGGSPAAWANNWWEWAKLQQRYNTPLAVTKKAAPTRARRTTARR